MKALMKATIARDYSVAVTSSCNIPTIPLAEAQALSPRPPSPASRDAAQRANRRENTNTLTPHDANVLVSYIILPRVEIVLELMIDVTGYLFWTTTTGKSTNVTQRSATLASLWSDPRPPNIQRLESVPSPSP